MANTAKKQSSKLFQLKEWLTVPEAARHLSTVFSEPVTEADILRLALDGHLTLSVNFVNHAKARRGRIVPIEDAQLMEVPPALAAAANLTPSDPSKPLMMVVRINIDDKNVLDLEPDVVTLAGTHDLPMIGAEWLDVEHQYQSLTDGPEVTLVNLEGTFVRVGDLTFQLQESFDDNEFQPGSRAAQEAIEQRIASGKLDQNEADKLRNQHAEQRKEFLATNQSRPKQEGYYPAGGLPSDSVLVVRTRVLRDFQERVESLSEHDDGNIHRRPETTYLNIIGALLDLLLGKSPSGKPHSVFKDQSAIIDILLELHDEKPGIKKRTLEEKFAAAKRSLGAS